MFETKYPDMPKHSHLDRMRYMHWYTKVTWHRRPAISSSKSFLLGPQALETYELRFYTGTTTTTTTKSTTTTTTTTESTTAAMTTAAAASECLDGLPAHCVSAVRWAMKDGIRQHPGWYPGLTGSSSFQDFQAQVNRATPDVCPPPRPCGPVPATAAPAAAPAAPAVAPAAPPAVPNCRAPRQ